MSCCGMGVCRTHAGCWAYLSCFQFQVSGFRFQGLGLRLRWRGGLCWCKIAGRMGIYVFSVRCSLARSFCLHTRVEDM